MKNKHETTHRWLMKMMVARCIALENLTSAAERIGKMAYVFETYCHELENEPEPGAQTIADILYDLEDYIKWRKELLTNVGQFDPFEQLVRAFNSNEEAQHKLTLRLQAAFEKIG